MVIDGYAGGTTRPASPIDGAIYQFVAVDEYSSYGYTYDCKNHTHDVVYDFVVSLPSERCRRRSALRNAGW